MDDLWGGLPDPDGPGSGPAADSHEEGGANRRDAGRTTLIYRPAMFATPSLIGLCVVRNVSEGGLMGNVFTALAHGTPITVRFSQRAAMNGNVRWSRDGQVGVQFSSPIDVQALLTEISLRIADGQVTRAPRLPLSFHGEVTVGGRKQWFEAHDISQYGIKLTAPNLREGEEVLLHIDGLDTRKAVVRWERRGFVGLRFLRPLSLNDLGAWAIARQAISDEDSALRASA